MMHVRTSLLALLTAAASACGGSTAPDTTPKNKSTTLDVAIASVTLADDCGTGPTAVPTEASQADVDPEGPSGSMHSSAKRASMSQIEGDRACEQSAIQLRVTNGTAAASKVAIEKIEVVDDSGAVVGELTPRAPSRWAGDSYEAWNEEVAPSETLQVSYALTSAPLSRGATYTVRVTLAAGDDQRTLEQKAYLEAEASLPPDAVT